MKFKRKKYDPADTEIRLESKAGKDGCSVYINGDQKGIMYKLSMMLIELYREEILGPAHLAAVFNQVIDFVENEDDYLEDAPEEDKTLTGATVIKFDKKTGEMLEKKEIDKETAEKLLEVLGQKED